jgi:hypothetical protein
VAEAASAALAQGRKYARRNPDRLSYRVQENARCVSVAAYDPLPNGNDDCTALNPDSSGEFDPSTVLLLEGLGDAIGMTRIELRGEWHAADAELRDRISDLQATGNNLERGLKMLTASYESAQARIAELEHQVATLTATRISTLEKDTEGFVKALRVRTARIGVLEDKVKAMGKATASEPAARDFDSRLAYVEALMSTMFPMRTSLQV